MDFPAFWTHELLCERLLRELLIDQKQQLENQKQILCNQEKIMALLDDVKAKIAKLKADVQAFIAANSGGASDEDLQALGASVDEIDAIVNPPATT
jgi:hypothetical protein